MGLAQQGHRYAVIINYIEFSKVDLLDEEFWSGIVKAKIKIPQGLFTRTAEEKLNRWLQFYKCNSIRNNFSRRQIKEPELVENLQDGYIPS